MNRDEVAAQDRCLPELYVSSRPTCDEAGVLLAIWADDGSRPIAQKGQVEGRLNIEQAKGVAHDLQTMVHIAERERYESVAYDPRESSLW
jgi:hypothetical protein